MDGRRQIVNWLVYKELMMVFSMMYKMATENNALEFTLFTRTARKVNN